jgi:hypothetical protein
MKQSLPDAEFANNAFVTASDKEQRLFKRHAVSSARRILSRLKMDNLSPNHFRRMVVRNLTFIQAVKILWLLGFWTPDIVLFIGDPATEEMVMGALRRAFVTEQAMILPSIAITLLECNNDETV